MLIVTYELYQHAGIGCNMAICLGMSLSFNPLCTLQVDYNPIFYSSDHGFRKVIYILHFPSIESSGYKDHNKSNDNSILMSTLASQLAVPPLLSGNLLHQGFPACMLSTFRPFQWSFSGDTHFFCRFLVVLEEILQNFTMFCAVILKISKIIIHTLIVM